MRLSFLPPPEPDELWGRKVHELVRDFPEVIPVLGASGISIQRDGGNTPAGSVVGDGDLERLLAAVAWRS
jgi:hypothetical protein